MAIMTTLRFPKPIELGGCPDGIVVCASSLMVRTAECVRDLGSDQSRRRLLIAAMALYQRVCDLCHVHTSMSWDFPDVEGRCPLPEYAAVVLEDAALLYAAWDCSESDGDWDSQGRELLDDMAFLLAGAFTNDEIDEAYHFTVGQMALSGDMLYPE